MLLRLCQLKSLLLLSLVLAGCSRFSWWKGRKDTHAHELISMYRPQWFKVNSEHSLIGADGDVPPHMFFDLNPEFSKDNRFVNLILTTPQHSAHHYRLDTFSGQRFFSHSYCPQKDAWGERPGLFERPQFSIGHIPKILDQLGEPQKVVFFADQRRVLNADLNYFRARLVGAYVEQSCPRGNCLGKDSWLSRLVLIAVDPEDKIFSKVNSGSELSRVINWPETAATLENLEGRNYVGDKATPYLKVGQLIAFEEALPYFKKRSIFLSETELKKIQSGCHTLYGRLWTEVGEERPEDRPAQNTEEVSKLAKLHQKLNEKRLPVGFARRFQAFTRNYYEEFVTCGKFVYQGNVNRNAEKFWFLAYSRIFFQLHKDGHFFDCKRKSWEKNALDHRGNPIHDLKRDIEFCTERDIDRAMNYLPNYLTGLKSTGTFYKFIDYDNHPFGTHNKLYSWVKLPVKKYECSHDPNEKILKEMKVFPDDVKWKERYRKEYNGEKIIY